MRLLITGAGGMLGHDVAVAARAAGHEPLALTRAQLDIADAGAVRAVIADASPDAVINCAAWTDVDGAEADEATATAVNGAGAGNVAAAAAQTGAMLVAVSTDYVFDGTARQPYTEDAAANPLSAYGRSKLAGEHAVAAAGDAARTAIVRSSWLFGAHGRNFVATMLRIASERSDVAVVDDQVGSPTYTAHLAGALVSVAERRLAGIHHVAAAGSCSWFDFAREIFRQADVRCRVLLSSTDEQGRPASRPAYSVLGVTRDDTPRLAPWQDGLTAYLAERRRGGEDSAAAATHAKASA
jgi:dTDP-4-dehydrorhamnose reductase